MEKYSRGRRGAPAKGVGRETGARVRISPAPPHKLIKSSDDSELFFYFFLIANLFKFLILNLILATINIQPAKSNIPALI